MAAYNFDTAAQLDAQLTSTAPVAGGSGVIVAGGSFDPATASAIVNFLNQAGDFNLPALVEGPTPLSGTDSTPNVDVYEITDSNFNSTALLALPGAPALIDTNTGPTTINIFDNYNANILLAANAGGNFINLHDSTGTDTILAGDGNNTVIAGNGQELVYLGSGNNSLVASAGQNTIYGSDTNGLSGNDFFQLNGGTNTLYAGSGNDTINAFGGQNVVTVGNGTDSINLYNATYSSSADTDSITLGSGNDTVNTGEGTGTINGGSGNDLIYIGQGGQWTFTGDTAPGASGSTDVVQVTDSSNPLLGFNTLQGGAGTTYFNIFGGINDAIGGSGTNVFDVTTAEQQTLTGGSGYNLYDIGTAGGSATDTIGGGSGFNEVNINATSGSISIDGSTTPHNSSVDFTQFSSTDATVTPSTAGGTSGTYVFGSGASQLTVTITDPTTTIKWH